MIAFVLVTPFAIPSLSDVRFAWGPFLAVVALGVFGTALAFVVMASNAGRLGSTRASVSVYIVPVVSLLLGALVRHESVAVLAIVGCAIAILGVSHQPLPPVAATCQCLSRGWPGRHGTVAAACRGRSWGRARRAPPAPAT